mgnify:CR=1 FL=1
MFVIFGIFLVVLVLLIFFLRAQIFGIQTTVSIDDQLAPLEDHITTCLTKIGKPLIQEIGKQGGYLVLTEDSYATYKETKISYLCYNRKEDQRCNNRMLMKKEIEETLSKTIEQKLPTCLDIKQFKKGLQLTIGNQQVVTTLGDQAILVTLYLPITLKKNKVILQKNNFTQTINHPLGKLYDVSKDIITAESTTGEFDILTYMATHKGEVHIRKKQPYPDKLYILKTRNKDYTFQFMIQGEPVS